MSQVNQEAAIQLGAGMNKLKEDIEELDSAVENYDQALGEYRNDEASREEVEQSVEEVIEEFSSVFSSQDWLGETTGDIAGAEPDNSYQSFTAYRGLVHAAHEIKKNKGHESITVNRTQRTSPVKEEYEDILETWEEFKQIYEDTVNLESLAQQISLEEGREEEGLEPYAFETPFMVLEERYQRISALNQCVNASYR